MALKPEDLKAYIEKCRAKGKSNRELELLPRALRLIRDQGQLPVEIKVRMLEEKNTRTGFATRPPIEAIITALPERLQDFPRLAYITGIRSFPLLHGKDGSRIDYKRVCEQERR